MVSSPAKRGLGLSVASLIVGGLGALFGFLDLSMVGNGVFGYVQYSEVGLILIIALIALGLAIGAMVKKQRASVAALVVSIVAMVVSFACAAYGG